ncbi:acyl-CoA dehydrogenase family protein [Novosphingobium sp.]|uniref:acyl-CoA dehydrogenase family protein n=1 Tax=Novosphingobium sp. TaxID=1874826 RepID=UPI003B5257A3
MEFAFTEEQRMIGETVRGFFAEHATSARTRTAMSGTGIDRQLWGAFAGELGLAGIGLPEEYGGVGLGMVELALVAEAAGTHVAALPLLGHVMLTQAIAKGGTEAQKSAWLPPLASGELIATAAWQADPVVRDGRMSGTFSYLPHGAVADLMLVHGKDGAWIVDLKGAGVTITAHVTMDQTRPLASAELVDAPADALELGDIAIAAALAAGWICLAAEALGAGQAAIDQTVAYSRERVQFGRPIGSFQAYKHRLADMVVEIEQARSAVWWAACAVDENSDEAALALHAAKSFAADTAFLCAGNMIQLHGGIGFTWDHDAHLYFKRARSIQTLLGTGAYHREAVAGMILGAAA